MSSHLQGITSFMESTAPSWATDPFTFYNLATIQNYETLGYMMRGRPYADVFKAGSELRERVFLEETPRMRSYLIGDEQDTVVTNPGTTMTSYFRFFMTDISWYDEPLIMNAGSTASRDAVKETWKNLWKQLWADNYTDQMNYWERYLWRSPVQADDTAAGQEFMGIPAYCNEYLYGLYGSTPMTTTKGVSSQTYYQHRNKVFPYTNFNANAADGIVEALDNAMMATKFQPPPLNREYFDPENGIDMSGGFIACSRSGKTKLMRTYRASNDVWVDKSDPYMNPTFAGAPIVYVRILDDALLYPTTGITARTYDTATTGGSGAPIAESTAQTGGTTASGPRYYMIQPRSLKIYWHKDRFIERLKPINDRRNPTLWTQFINTFGTSMGIKRRQLALIYPNAALA